MQIEKQLREQFPVLYSGKHTSIGGTGDGWDEIILNLSEQLTGMIPDGYGEDKPWLLPVLQIKEKFGSLRFYTGAWLNEPSVPQSVYPDGWDDAIHAAQSLSDKTCEGCGTTDEVTTKGRPDWFKTLCPPCGKKFKEHGCKALHEEHNNV